MYRYKRPLEKDAAKTPKQKRGEEQGVQSHFRITLELRHLILKYCSPDSPVGALDRSLLIVGGEHCRLDNIDVNTSTWIHDEEFIVKTASGEQLVQRKGGLKTNGNMKEWVALKRRAPHLFEHVEVMAQPCAVTDSLITKWSMESMQKRHGCTLWMRDSCGGGGKSVCGEQLAFVCNQAAHFIAGKMTSAVQITDTDFSYRLKAFAAEAGRGLRREQKAAVAQSAHADAELENWGCRELLEIVHRSLTKMIEVEKAEQITLKAAVRNGFLAWRPCMKTRTLYDPREEDWMKGFGQPDTSHRLCAAWVADRWKWTQDGVPQKAHKVENIGVEDVLVPEDWTVRTVPGPHEVVMVSTLEGPDILAPIEEVGGNKYRQVQVFCGDFNFEESAKEDFHRLLESQCSFKNRMLNMKIPEGLQEEYDTRAKKKKEQTRGREVRRLKRQEAWGTATAARAVKREKMRKRCRPLASVQSRWPRAWW